MLLSVADLARCAEHTHGNVLSTEPSAGSHRSSLGNTGSGDEAGPCHMCPAHTKTPTQDAHAHGAHEHTHVYYQTAQDSVSIVAVQSSPVARV